MRASFFDYDPTISAYRFIQLSDDTPELEVSESHQHEEGWSSTYVRWALDGDVVTCEEHTDGRDCDGRMSTSTTAWCPVSALAAVEVYASGDHEASEGGPLPFRVPEWRQGRRSRRDYSAEAAGY